MTLDSLGMIASKTWKGTIDGGDTMAEQGRINFLSKVIIKHNLVLPVSHAQLMPLSNSIARLMNQNGQWVRSPIDYTNPNDVSRDQTDPVIMAMSMEDPPMDAMLNSQCKILRKNWLRYQGGDVASPENEGHFFRHRKTWWRPLYFYLSDIFMLLNSIIICYLGGGTPTFENTDQGVVVKHNVQNDLNHICSLVHAEEMRPTLISRLAAIVYFSDRPAFDDNGNRTFVMQGWRYALVRYYLPYTGNDDLIEYYQKCIMWLLNRI